VPAGRQRQPRTPDEEKRWVLEEIADVRVPHVVFVDGVDGRGDADGDGVPAQLVGVGCVEVVLGVLAGAAVVLDDVLLGVADHDREIAVLLDALFGDGLDGALAAVTVDRDDTVDYSRGEFPRRFQRCLPLVDRRHAPELVGRRQNGVGVRTHPAGVASRPDTHNRRRDQPTP